MVKLRPLLVAFTFFKILLIATFIELRRLEYSYIVWLLIHMVDLRYNYPRLPWQDEFILNTKIPECYSEQQIVENELREDIAKWLSVEKFKIHPSQITFVCSGTQALYVLAIAAKLPGQSVVVDPLTYNGFIKLAGFLSINLIVCPIDEHGFKVDQLSAICSNHNVRALYLIPTIHNPLAFTIPLERRRSIADIAKAFDLLIIEDDAYAFLADKKIEPFLRIAPERTFSVHSLTKIVDQNFKLGVLVTPREWRADMQKVVELTSGKPSLFFQVSALTWIRDGTLDFLISKKKTLAKERLLIVQEVLHRFKYTQHQTGFHVWLPIELGVDVEEIVSTITSAGTDVLSSKECQVSSDCEMQGLRIAFGNVRSDEELIRGLTVIGRIVAR